MLLEGMFLPLTTPFHPDGRLFLRKLQGNVARYSLTSAAGMLVLSSAGEVDSLGDEECREVLKSAMEAAAEAKVMVAEVGRGGVGGTLRMAEVAAEVGYDAVLVRAPGWAGDAGLGRELRTYFGAVADGSALPVVLAGGLEAEVVGELAGHPNVVGAVAGTAERVRAVLAATVGVRREVTVTPVFAAVTRRMLRVGEALVPAEGLSGGGTVLATSAPARARTRTKAVGFQVLATSAGEMLESWRAGASGAVPRLAACAPQGCCEVWQAYKDGDVELAEEKLERVREIGGMMEGFGGIAGLKFGCDLNGYFGGRPRLPLLMASVERQEEVARRLAELRN